MTDNRWTPPDAFEIARTFQWTRDQIQSMRSGEITDTTTFDPAVLWDDDRTQGLIKHRGWWHPLTCGPWQGWQWHYRRRMTERSDATDAEPPWLIRCGRIVWPREPASDPVLMAISPTEAASVGIPPIRYQDPDGISFTGDVRALFSSFQVHGWEASQVLGGGGAREGDAVEPDSPHTPEHVLWHWTTMDQRGGFKWECPYKAWHALECGTRWSGWPVTHLEWSVDRFCRVREVPSIHDTWNTPWRVYDRLKSHLSPAAKRACVRHIFDETDG